MTRAAATPQILARLGRSIRARRAELGLSQAEAAWRAGYDTSYWGRIERAETNPTLLTLAAIAGALGSGLHDLLHQIDHS